MHQKFLQADKLAQEIYAAALKVQQHFGIGLLESIYVKALSRELEFAGHICEEEKLCKIEYRGRVWSEKLRADLIIDDCLVVEAKAIEPCSLKPARMQVLSYMKLMDYPLGLVINLAVLHYPKNAPHKSRGRPNLIQRGFWGGPAAGWAPRRASQPLVDVG